VAPLAAPVAVERGRRADARDASRP
jgi:hypothetical protein